MAETGNKDVAKVEAEAVERRNAQPEYMPLVDIYEQEDGTTVLEAELPGAKEQNVDIRVEKGVLTIIAPAEIETYPEYGRTYTGFSGGRYFRAFALSDEIDRDKIDASFADGVLTVRLPKAEAAQTRKIKISST